MVLDKHIKIVDISFNCSPQFNDPNLLIEAYKAGFGYIKYIKDRVDIRIIEHLDYEGPLNWEGVPCSFFKSKNKFWYIPFKTLKYLKKTYPDIVFAQGLHFPFQIIATRLFLPKKTKIVVQHHFEAPYKGIKKTFQKAADRFIDAYIFTSFGNARPWFDAKIIKDQGKCHEINEGSTSFTKRDKQESKSKTGMSGDYNFLWVGRLVSRKEPLTMLAGFKKYLEINPVARLHMIYGTDELLVDVKSFLQSNEALKNSVSLVGAISHEQLEKWYSAADFYVASSQDEGTSFALIESMACGCIPLITDIPASKKITDNGKFGVLYKAGSSEDLYEKLCGLEKINREEFSQSIIEHFDNKLSFKSIANDLYRVFRGFVE